MYKVLMITDEANARGFRLSGIEVNVADHATVETVLAAAQKRENLALIIIDEGLLAGLSAETQDAIIESTFPMIIPIPSVIGKKAKAADQETYIQRMVRKSIGHQLNVTT